MASTVISSFRLHVRTTQGNVSAKYIQERGLTAQYAETRTARQGWGKTMKTMQFYLIMTRKEDNSPKDLRPITDANASAFLKAGFRRSITSDHELRERETQARAAIENKELFGEEIHDHQFR